MPREEKKEDTINGLKDITDIKKERQEKIDSNELYEPLGENQVVPSPGPISPDITASQAQVPQQENINAKPQNINTDLNKFIEDASKSMLDASLNMEKAIVSLEKIFIKNDNMGSYLKDSLHEIYDLKEDIKKMSEVIIKYKMK